MIEDSRIDSIPPSQLFKDPTMIGHKAVSVRVIKCAIEDVPEDYIWLTVNGNSVIVKNPGKM